MTWENIAIFIFASLMGSVLVSYVMTRTSRQESREKQLEAELATAKREIADLKAMQQALQRLLVSTQAELTEVREQQARNMVQQARDAERIHELEIERATERATGGLHPPAKVRKLKPVEITKLRDAIISAFNVSELGFVLTSMGRDIETIAREGGTYEEHVQDVVMRANREGWISELLTALAAARPKRADFVQIVNALNVEL